MLDTIEASRPVATLPLGAPPRTTASRPTAHTAGLAQDELLAGLRRGDERSYEALVRDNGGRMLAVARRLLRNEEDARDAVQDALVSAFRAIDRFDGRCSLSTWLHRIVVNAALMRLRSAKRRRESPLEETSPGHDLGEPSESTLAPPTEPIAEAAVLRGELNQALRLCLHRLPAPQRLIVTLRDVEGLSTREAAASLGITENAVKIRLHRARAALLALLRDHLTVARSTHAAAC